MMSGIFWGEYDDDTPLTRTGYMQVPGALEGLLNELYPNPGECWLDEFDAVVCEKFTPRPKEAQWKLEELEPIRIEGAIFLASGGRVHWQDPGRMVLASGKDQAARKRSGDDVLRRAGWWLTGRDVNYKDANDVNAAAKHALAYMRSIRHEPTIDAYLV